jgi:hypothetical protein
MKINLTQISISDRVNAAKSQNSPSNTDTSAVPMELNPSPGDSTMSNIDTTQLDSAGANVNSKTQEGNRATSDSARKANNPANQNLQYDKQVVSSEDQAPSAGKKEDLIATQPPKSKGFKESLMDATLSNMMGDKTGGDKGSVNKDFGHDNGNPNEHVKNQPESEPIRRTQPTPYDTSDTKIKEPSKFPITSFDKTNNMESYNAPKQDLGPTYKQRDMATPKAPAPKIKFNTPKINTPRFK